MESYNIKAKRKVDEEKIAKISFWTICASLFTYGFCFSIIDERVAGAFMAVFVIVEIIRQRYIAVDLPFIILVETMLCVALVDFHTLETYMHSLHWAWVLPLGYLLGKAVAGDNSDANRRTFIAFASLSGGMFAQGVVDYTYGFTQWIRWGNPTDCWVQFWPYQFESRNTIEIEFLLTVATLGVAVHIYNTNRRLSLALLFANVYFQIVSFIAKGRGQLLYAMAALIIFEIMHIYEKRFKLSKKEKKILLAASLTIFILAVLGIVFIEFRFFGLIEVNEDSRWFRNGGLLHNVRFQINKDALKLLIQNPLGGLFDVPGMGTSGKSHNTWTEYGREWGFMPFILLNLYTLMTIIDAIRLAMKRDISSSIKYTLCTSLFILYLYFAMEPTGYSRRHFMLFAFFVSGMIRRQLEIKS